jgi:hypothetical protein
MEPECRLLFSPQPLLGDWRFECTGPTKNADEPLSAKVIFQSAMRLSTIR